MLSQLTRAPVRPFKGETPEELRDIEPPNHAGFTILQDSHILDLRPWNPTKEGKTDAASLVYGYRRLKVLKNDNSGNDIFRATSLPTNAESQFRFPPQRFPPKLLRANVENSPRQETLCRFEVSVDLASVDTNDPKRDDHLRSADFFEIDKHPRMTFKSTRVTQDGDGWKLTGDLTVRDVTRPVTLDVEFEGASTTPWNTSAFGFSATGEIDRDDWGISWNAALETGGMLVGKKVKIELNVELLPAS
jgi:polyisoprenoid-binding protein YceI